MDPIHFHQELYNMSEVLSTKVLINRVLHKPDSSPIPAQNSELIAKVSKIIENFITENQDQLYKTDASALIRLKTIITFFHDDQVEHNELTTLEKTIDTAIRIAQQNTNPLPIPSSLMEIVNEYSSLDSINLILAGKTDSKRRGDTSFAHANQSEIEDFVTNLRQRSDSNPDIFKEMIELFFKSATPMQQAHFFSSIKPQEMDFLTKILLLLPKNLTHLNINDFNHEPFDCIRDYHIKIIVKQLPLLEFLSLDQCHNLTDGAGSAIASNLTNLQTLSFDDCHLTDATPIAIAESSKMNKLKNLSLNHCTLLTDQTSIAIARSTNMSRLESLELGALPLLTIISTGALAGSPNMSNLQKLDLWRCPLLDDLAFNPFVESPHLKLQSLNLSNCPITDVTIVGFARSDNMVNLKSLTCDCPLTDVAINALAESPFIRLKRLNFSRSLVSNGGVETLANSSNMSELQVLRLPNCVHLTDTALIAIANSANMPLLAELDFQRCILLTDASAEALANSPYRKKLKGLMLSNNPHITNATVQAFASSNKSNLNYLFLQNCPLVTDQANEIIEKGGHLIKLIK